jgi:hypothetical protein
MCACAHVCVGVCCTRVSGAWALACVMLGSLRLLSGEKEAPVDQALVFYGLVSC